MSTLVLALVVNAALTCLMIISGLTYLAYRRPAVVPPMGIALTVTALMVATVSVVVTTGTGG